MILAQVKDYLAEQGAVPIAGLAARFEVAPETMRGMLSHFVRRGLVRAVRDREVCAGCTKCDAGFREVYAWTGNDAPTSGNGGMSAVASPGARIHST
jgi:hypothetical protein